MAELERERREGERETQVDRFEPTIEQMRAILDLEGDPSVDISRSDPAGNHYIEMATTRHPKGGRHLYVADAGDPTRVWHIARNGNATLCEGALRKRTPTRRWTLR